MTIAQFDSVVENALVWVADQTPAVVAKMPTLVMDVLEELDTSRQWHCSEYTNVDWTVFGQNTFGTVGQWPSDPGVDMGFSKAAIARPWFIDTRMRPWFQSGPTAKPTVIHWLPTDESQRPRDFHQFDDTQTGPPRFIDIVAHRGEQALLTDAGVVAYVWPFPDGNSLWPGPFNIGEYKLFIPYFRRQSPGDEEPVVPEGDNWFLYRLQKYVELRAGAAGAFMNRDTSEAAVLEARAKEELERIVNNEKRTKLKSRTLRRSMGAKHHVIRRMT